MASAFFVLGKGIRERNSPFRQAYVFGAELNAVNTAGWYSPLDIMDPTTLFDLSTITINHEVVVALVNVRTDGPYSLAVNFKWYRDRDNALLFDMTVSQSASYAAEQSAFSYSGWLDREISENGGYHVAITVTGTLSFNYTLHFTVSGIPAVITPPSPVVPFVDAIFSAVWDAKVYIYVAYRIVEGWVWPFSILSAPLYTLYVVVNSLLTPIANFGDWVADVVTKVANILNAKSIIALLQTWLTYASDAWSWVVAWYKNVIDAVEIWWSIVKQTVQGWIDIAKQAVLSLVATINTMLINLQTAWDNFRTITLPKLATNLSVTSLIDSRLKLWFPFYDDLSILWGTIALFFTNPLDYLLDKFTDWFLGPEV